MKLKQILLSFEQNIQLLFEGSFDKSINRSFERDVEEDRLSEKDVKSREIEPLQSVDSREIPVDVTREIKQAQDETRSAIKDLPETLLILDGRQHVSFRRAVIRIGRHLDNDMVLDLPEISRFHAQISWRNRRAWLRDLSSASGIYLNGERIVSSLLYNGDVIRIGSHSIVFGTEEEIPTSSIRTFGESPTSVLKSTKGE